MRLHAVRDDAEEEAAPAVAGRHAVQRSEHAERVERAREKSWASHDNEQVDRFVSSSITPPACFSNWEPTTITQQTSCGGCMRSSAILRLYGVSYHNVHPSMRACAEHVHLMCMCMQAVRQRVAVVVPCGAIFDHLPRRYEANCLMTASIGSRQIGHVCPRSLRSLAHAKLLAYGTWQHGGTRVMSASCTLGSQQAGGAPWTPPPP